MVNPVKFHLVDMLSADHLTEEDKDSIRFAMLVMMGTPNILVQPKVPYWRYVEYADDGCSIYQCLECKEKWEARTSPGWMEHYQNESGQFIDWPEPVYHPVFKLCPFCGIKWKGPIRRDQGNEQMLGPKRLKRYNQIKDDGIRNRFVPDWWMVIQWREIGVERGPGKWVDKCKFSPYRHSPKMVIAEVNDLRQRTAEDDADRPNPFRKGSEFRATTRSQKEMKERYPIYWQELNEQR